MNDPRYALFAAAVVGSDLESLEALLVSGLDPNLTITVETLPTAGVFDAWRYLASVLFSADDSFRADWPQAFATLVLLIEYGLDLTSPPSSAPHMITRTRLEFLQEHQPNLTQTFVPQAQATWEQRVLEAYTDPASASVHLPARL